MTASNMADTLRGGAARMNPASVFLRDAVKAGPIRRQGDKKQPGTLTQRYNAVLLVRKEPQGWTS